MKVLVLTLFIFTFINYSIQQTPQEIDAAVNDCKASTNVDPKLQQNLYLKGEFANDQKLKCFIKCMGVKFGGMGESGELILDTVKEKMGQDGLPEDQVDKIIDKCKGKTGADPCDIAFNVAKCMMDEAMHLNKN